MSHLLKHKPLVIFGTILVLGFAGGAYAYWTTGGSGSGSAGTGTNNSIAITQTSTPAGLYPGGAPAALAGKFNNANAGAVHVDEVSATIGTVTGPNITVGTPCTAADYVLAGFPVQVDADVATGTAVGAWSGGSIAMVDGVGNQDGCKGATINLLYTSN